VVQESTQHARWATRQRERPASPLGQEMRRPCFTASRQIDGIEAAQIERQHPWRGSERRRAARDGRGAVAQQQDLKPQVRSAEAEVPVRRKCASGGAAVVVGIGAAVIGVMGCCDPLWPAIALLRKDNVPRHSRLVDDDLGTQFG
jgi:hypothetical protein